MAFAARLSDLIVSTATVGIPTPIVGPCTPNVLIGGLPAARLSDTCGLDAVIMGSTTVTIGGLPAARMGDPTGAGGSIIGPGAPTVIIGG